jgi:hypothetical protein
MNGLQNSIGKNEFMLRVLLFVVGATAVTIFTGAVPWILDLQQHYLAWLVALGVSSERANLIGSIAYGVTCGGAICAPIILAFWLTRERLTAWNNDQLVRAAIEILSDIPKHRADAERGAPASNTTVGAALALTMQCPRWAAEVAVRDALEILGEHRADAETDNKEDIEILVWKSITVWLADRRLIAKRWNSFR